MQLHAVLATFFSFLLLYLTVCHRRVFINQHRLIWSIPLTANTVIGLIIVVILLMANLCRKVHESSCNEKTNLFATIGAYL